jgi:hypothetical protein
VLADLNQVIIHADVVGGSAGDRAARSPHWRPVFRWAVSTMRRCMVPSLGPAAQVRRESLLVILVPQFRRVTCGAFLLTW